MTRRLALQLGLLGAGVLLVVIGILASDVIVVLRKAIYICLECIGIG
jgi:hypothetical protein